MENKSATKLVQLCFDESGTMVVCVPADWSDDDIETKYNNMLDELMAQKKFCSSSSVAPDVLAAYGFRPVQLSQVLLDERELESEYMAEHDISYPCCAHCTSNDDGACFRYGGRISNYHEEKDCCRSDYLYDARYGDETICTFVLLDESLLYEDEGALKRSLAEFFPSVAALMEHDPPLDGLSIELSL